VTAGARWAWTGTGLVLAISAIALAATNATSLLWLRSEDSTRTFPATGSVVVESGCGSITIQAGGPGTVQLRSHVSWSFDKPTVTTTTDRVTTRVTVDCAGFAFGTGNTADVTVTVPATEDVSISSADGDAQVFGITGTVTASSSAGDVNVADLSGRATLDSSAGSIDAKRLASAQVTARSSAGDVVLAFASPPQKVTASSSAGAVRVLLPHASVAYRVTVQSTAGSTSVSVPTDPTSSRSIDASSTADDVEVGYGP
jgi:DUF4097 and DUF4098 domain-containing protein YvlB